MTALLSTLLAVFYDLDKLASMISAGTIISYIAVCSGILILRYKPNVSDITEMETLTGKKRKTCGYETRLKNYIWLTVTIFILLVLFAGYSLKFSLHISAQIVPSILAFIIMIYLCFERQEKK